MTGRIVDTLINNEKQTPGRYKAIANVEQLPSGNYFYQLNVNGNVITDKLVVAH